MQDGLSLKNFARRILRWKQRSVQSDKMNTNNMLTATIIGELLNAVGAGGLIIERNQLQTYECDGLAALRNLPAAVVLPRTAAELQAVVRICAMHRIPFVGRGAGTGLSGGALPNDRGIVISFSR